MLFEELKNCPFLVMSNEQHWNNILSSIDIVNKIKMKELKDRTWLVQSTSATNLKL